VKDDTFNKYVAYTVKVFPIQNLMKTLIYRDLIQMVLGKLSEDTAISIKLEQCLLLDGLVVIFLLYLPRLLYKIPV